MFLESFGTSTLDIELEVGNQAPQPHGTSWHVLNIIGNLYNILDMGLVGGNLSPPTELPRTSLRFLGTSRAS